MPSLDLLLKGHAGEHARVDRIGRPSLLIPHATLAVGLAVQPHVIETLATKPGFRERGLIARFLFSLPKNTIGHRLARPPAMPSDVSAAYEASLNALLALPTTIDAGRDPVTIELDAAARDFIEALVDHIEPQLGEDGPLFSIADWAGKLVGTVARIATLLHLCEHPHAQSVELAAVEAA